RQRGPAGRRGAARSRRALPRDRAVRAVPLRGQRRARRLVAPGRARDVATIAIVGAGCSGTLTALHLLVREAPAGTRIALFERRGLFGPGRAYATAHPAHRLNVPAGAMSAFADRPSHFLDWARARVPEA